MEDAADMAGVSYYHFNRLFKKATNMNYNQYCHQLKLQSIKELLLQSTMTITDIAENIRTNRKKVTYYAKSLFTNLGICP